MKRDKLIGESISSTAGGAGLIWWSEFLGVPLSEITAIPCVERDGKLVPAVSGCRRERLDAGEFRLGVRDESYYKLARSGWQMDIGGLPIIAFDLDDDVPVEWEGGSEGSASWFFSLLSDLGYSDLLSNLVVVSTPSGGSHVYFRDTNLGTETFKESMLRMNPYYKYLRILPGVELFLCRPLTVFGSVRSSGVYDLRLYPSCFSEMSDLPPALMYVLSGGRVGHLTEEQRLVLMSPKYRVLWDWYLAFSDEMSAKRRRTSLAAKPSQFYLYCWSNRLIRRDWVLDFLRESSMKMYGVPGWELSSTGDDYSGRCLFHHDSSPSATFSIKSPEPSDVEYLSRFMGESYSDEIGEQAYRFVYRCFTCVDCASEASRKHMQQQFYNFMLLYGSWLYDRGLMDERVAIGYIARLHGLAFGTVGSKWLLSAVANGSLSTSLLGLDYRKDARRFTRGRSMRVGVSDDRVVGGGVRVTGGSGNSRSTRRRSSKKNGSASVFHVVSHALYSRSGRRYVLDGIRSLAASQSYESFADGLPSGYKEWESYLKELEGRSLRDLVVLYLDWASKLGLYGSEDSYVIGIIFEVGKRFGIRIKPEWLVGYDITRPVLGFTVEEMADLMEVGSMEETKRIDSFDVDGSDKEVVNGTQNDESARNGFCSVSSRSLLFDDVILYRFDKTYADEKPFLLEDDNADYLCQGLIRPKQIIIITGRPGAYKSTVIRNLATALSSGGSFLGRRCDISRVLYVSYDEPYEYLIDRLDPLAARIPLHLRPTVLNVRHERWRDIVEMEYSGDEFFALFESCAELGARVMFVDTLKSLLLVWRRSRMSGRFSEQVEPQAFMDELRRMASEYDVTVIATDHSPKSLNRLGDDPDRYIDTSDAVLGHTAYAAGADAVWYCEKIANADNMARLRSSKCRHKPFDYKLYLDANAILVYRYQSMENRSDTGYDPYYLDFDGVDYNRVMWRRGVEDIILPFPVLDELRSLRARYMKGVGGDGSGGSNGVGVSAKRPDQPPSNPPVNGYIEVDGAVYVDGGDQVVEATIVESNDGGSGRTESSDRKRNFLYYNDQLVRHGRRYVLTDSEQDDGDTVALMAVPQGVSVDDLAAKGGRILRQVRVLPYVSKSSGTDGKQGNGVGSKSESGDTTIEGTNLFGSDNGGSVQGDSDLAQTGGRRVSDEDWVIDGYLLKFAVDGYRPFSESNITDVKHVVFDMETSHVSHKLGRILAIGVYRGDGDSVVFDGDDELSIIRSFDEYLLRYDPDWLVGYNILSFDLPYLEARAKALGYELGFLNKYFRKRHIKYRYGSSYEDVDVYFTRGNLDLSSYARKAVIDLYLLALRHLPDLERYRLVDVVEHYFGEDSVRKSLGDKAVMSEWSSDAVRSQVLGDVEMTSKLLPRLLSAEFFLARYVPMPFSQLVYSGMGARWQLMMAGEYLSRGYVILDMPTPKSEYVGAISECYETGVFSPVAKVDVASLYPSIIIKHNVHPRSDYMALLPEMVKGMMETRLEYKRLAKSGDKFYEGMQWALKILINSAYGFLGAEGIRFADMDAAAKVTSVGRETLRYMMRCLSKIGTVIEVDTDGVLVTYRDRDELEGVVRDMMDETGYTMEIDYYRSAVVLAAKNYALLKDDDEVVIHGSSLRSRSASVYIQRLIRELLNRLLRVEDESDYDRIVEWVAETALSFRDVPADQLIERIRISNKTLNRKELAFSSDENLRVGDTCYIYYEVGRPGRVVRKTLPESINLDRSKYLLRYYKSIERFRNVKPFWRRFEARFGGPNRFSSILSGQADLFSG